MDAAFFDLDKTVIARPSMVAFGRSFRRAGIISRWLLLRAAWNGVVFHVLGADEARMRKFRESALRVTRGWDRDVVRAHVRENLTDVIDPIVYDEALDLLRHHRDAGHLVYLVSASPEEIVVPLAEHLGVDGAIASRARVDDDGKYTGEVDVYAYGPHKASAIVELAQGLGIDLSTSWAYSDSATDEPMLRAVGNPVVVNPDRDLARLAEAEEWPVLSFTHPVPLRERVPLPSAGPMMAGAAVVIGLSAGLLIGRGISGRRTATAARRRPSGLRRPAASSPRERRGRPRRGARATSSWRAL